MLDRLAAIEAVSHSHTVLTVEHQLLDLVALLESGRLHRSSAVSMLMEFISAEPARVGAVETVEFVMAALGWEELRIALIELRDSASANFRNRNLARSALEAGDPNWRGGVYRTFRKDGGSSDASIEV